MADMRRSLPVLIAALVLIALPAGWWFGSPWWTLWRMREAAASNDADALANYIDYPALRASTFEQVKARVPDIPGLPDIDDYAGMAVSRFMTPEFWQLALTDPREGSTPADLDLVRKGPNEFRLRRKGWIGVGNELVFRRHGLAWRLEAINLDPAG